MTDYDFENVAELYYSKLKRTTNAGYDLAKFLGVVLNIEVSRSHVMVMNKLIKLYGRYLVYFSILGLTRIKDKDKENYYPILDSICKAKFEQSHQGSLLLPYNDLTREINRLEKEVEKAKKRKIKIPDYSDLSAKEKDIEENE